MKLPVARAGLPFILPSGIVSVGAAVLWSSGSVPPGAGRIAVALLAAAAGTATLFCIWFFRDPEREIPANDDLVVAPADGKVMDVTPVRHEPFLDGAATRVTIFLNIFNVHVQRAPLGGTVTHYRYEPGRYLAAWREEASAANERASLGIETSGGPVLVRQIAGLVARRIITDPREGQSLAKGDRIGLIRFGSRVDLFLPPKWRVTVAAGDVVRGGETPVARVPASSAPEPPAPPEPPESPE